ASKIRWLLDAVPGLPERARAGEIAFGTIDSFLLWRLTGGRLHATDVTNASRTMLFDLHRLAWVEELLDGFGIPSALLPERCDACATGSARSPPPRNRQRWRRGPTRASGSISCRPSPASARPGGRRRRAARSLG